MQASDRDLYHVRVLFMALAVIMIGGSFLLRFVPSVGFSMFAPKIDMGGPVDIWALQEQIQMVGVRLFNGMSWHCQSLAAMVAIFSAWVLIDMMLVERRVKWLHAILVGISPILLYWTSSRTGFLVFTFAMGPIWVFLLPKARLPAGFRRKMNSAFMAFCAVLVLAAVVLELRSSTITQWLRKTTTREETISDERGFIEAVTDSRQYLVEMNMRDFHLNPMCGMGFQVMEEHRGLYQAGLITLFSAPIEKGVAPLMILGETGIVGAIIFVIFLVAFSIILIRKGCVATVTLFWTMCMSNLSEATMFSPSGVGGILWCFCAIGGMAIDVIVLRRSISEIRH